DFGSLNVGMVRKDHNTANGSGEIARMEFIANPLIQGNVTFNMGFSNARVITYDGTQIPVNIVNNNPITISQLLNINDLSSTINFVVKPNQVKDVMAIDYNLAKGGNVNIAITNMIGERVKQVINESQATGKH